MSEQALTTTEAPAPAKPKTVRRRRKVAKRAKAERPAAPPKPAGIDFSGMTATTCPDACRGGICVISTVEHCKHPLKSGDAGCGPITMANREKARKYLKARKAD